MPFGYPDGCGKISPRRVVPPTSPAPPATRRRTRSWLRSRRSEVIARSTGFSPLRQGTYRPAVHNLSPHNERSRESRGRSNVSKPELQWVTALSRSFSRSPRDEQICTAGRDRVALILRFHFGHRCRDPCIQGGSRGSKFKLTAKAVRWPICPRAARARPSRLYVKFPV